MLDPDYFDKINEIAKIVRKRSKHAFGGIQLILIADFCQLPPVPKRGKPVTVDTKRYIFQTETWKELQLSMVKLDFNFRQQSDDTFKRLLHSVRLGKLSNDDYALLASRDMSRLKKEGNVTANEDEMTKLFSYRADVQRINKEALDKIDAPIRRFEAEIYLCPALRKKHEEQLQYSTNNKGAAANNSHYPVDEVIELKVGATVLLCYNLDVEVGLFNGCKGVITEFIDIIPKGMALEKIIDPQKQCVFPMVKFYNGELRPILPNKFEQRDGKMLISSFTQIPLMLSYAVTIHRAQGLTLNSVLVNMKFFETGQAYVSLSRVRQLKDLYLTNFIGNSNVKAQIRADPTVVEFYTKNDLL